jgi:GMP synthase-like glutamine amidotransferase
MILIVDMNFNGSLGFYEFVLPLCEIVKPLEYEVKHYLEVTDVKTYEKIILSGTALKDFEYLKHIKSFEWIRTCDMPILGICAGMQAIGMVFGSLLTPCKEIGMTEVETVKENYLFSSAFRAYELHNLGVEPSDVFEMLAMSKKCIQGIKHKEKDFYSVLFHPEVRNKEIIRRFVHSYSLI